MKKKTTHDTTLGTGAAIAALGLAALALSACTATQNKWLAHHEFVGDHSVKYIHQTRAEGTASSSRLLLEICDVESDSSQKNCKESELLVLSDTAADGGAP